MRNHPSKRPDPEQSAHDQRVALIRAVLVAGGGFGTTIATILAVAGQWHVGDKAILWALGTLCFVAAITMFIAVHLTRPGR
ncbi:hypothetical protein [Actinoplanes palleronii]|uniref:Uncharacterized protein n=1 Tax=Actinoplanes palleronii TaxID=113570 RepID=A0ABQ4B4F9_9ACTN|nr:hypothetical protein [Actinoplanes palleronii]GIE65542.1 hypothetical protein Apa02nite_016500 [Actinoplanes palleronii]